MSSFPHLWYLNLLIGTAIMDSSFTHPLRVYTCRLVSSLAKPNSVKLRQAMDGAPSPVLIAIKSYRRVSHLLHAQDVMMMMLLEL